MNTILTESIGRSMSYKNYRRLVKQLAEDSTTTGNNKTEALVKYTKLNDILMRRWDNTIKIPEEFKKKIKEFNKLVTWLVITESWCRDSAHIIPVLNKIAKLNPNLVYRILLENENPKLIKTIITNDVCEMPKLIMLDNLSMKIVATFGPRPSKATSYVNRFIAENGTLTPDFKKDLHYWYNKNSGHNIIEDIIEKLNKI